MSVIKLKQEIKKEKSIKCGNEKAFEKISELIALNKNCIEETEHKAFSHYYNSVLSRIRDKYS